MMKNYVFIGGSGSGKSEVAINFALMLTKKSNKEIYFFDMDQTKPLFRSREAKDILIKNHIVFHSGEQLLDTPVVPHGVYDSLRNENSNVILDLGGNVIGALTAGQFSEIINKSNTVVFYVFNCYRPFSAVKKNILEDISRIKAAAQIRNVSIVSNPNFGRATTLEDVLAGYEKTCSLFKNSKYEVSLLCVPEWLYDTVKQYGLTAIMRITPYILM